MSEWKKLSERIVYENPWMNIREDKVIRPDGKEGIYGFMQLKNRGCGIVLVNNQHQIFVQEEFRYPIQKAVLEVPSGGIEPGEDPLVGAKRELKEETGYEATVWKHLGQFYTTDGFANEKAHIFLANGVVTKGDLMDEGDTQVVSQRWMDIDEAYRMLDAGELEESYIIVALALARQYLML